MRFASTVRLAPILLLAGSIAPLAAQLDPLGPVRSLCSSTPGEVRCLDPEVNRRPPNGFLVASSFEFYPEQSIEATFATGVDWLDAAGHLAGGATFDRGSVANDFAPESPSAGADARGAFVGAWHTVLFFESDAMFLRFGADGRPLGEPVPLGAPRGGLCQWNPRVAVNRSGAFAIAWQESDGCQVEKTTIALQAFDPSGRPTSPVLAVEPRLPAGTVSDHRLAFGDGGVVQILWRDKRDAHSPEKGIWFRALYAFDGRFFGRQRIDPAGAFARAPDGRFVVAWGEGAAAGPGRVVLQAFKANGARWKRPQVVATTAGAVTVEALSLDQNGNFVVVWRDGGRVRAALFNAALVPQGGPTDVGTGLVGIAFAPRNAGAALDDSGRLLFAWTAPRIEPAPGERLIPVVTQLWRARHDDDLCVVRDRTFHCDTRGDGGAGEEVVTFGTNRHGERSLVADWDGDGRDDPCIYFHGRFVCNTGHDGRVRGESGTVGQAGDEPLLGDLDGDRRADPCVRRGELFLCRPQAAGMPEVRIAFGRVSDRALLGDVDGDGRDDPCVVRPGRILCDSAHDGREAEIELDLRPALAVIPGGAPLLGDVDGDGRDDPCVVDERELACALPTADGGPPTIVRRSTGGPGRFYLLGDVDGF